jgi:hypothetical protein
VVVWAVQNGVCNLVGAIADGIKHLCDVSSHTVKSGSKASFASGLSTLCIAPIDLHKKFKTDTANLRFNYGGMGDFYGGLEQLVGPPEPAVLNAMVNEHCHSMRSEEQFSVLVNKKEMWTTPMQEWKYVMHPDSKYKTTGIADVERDGRPDNTLAFFMRSTKVRRAKLNLEEVIALRLYTGPMYKHYNTVLRTSIKGHSSLPQTPAPHLNYVTTIHAINSAILKLSRIQRAEKVYWGVADGVLPDKFWCENEFGVRGGVEAGFRSTTTNRDVAFSNFAVPSKLGGASMLFESQMGMVNRGAGVAWCSQYPKEAEVLFAPLTSLEVCKDGESHSLNNSVSGGTNSDLCYVDGNTICVPVRMNCNLQVFGTLMPGV